jgi:hypothetical protein
MKLAILMLGKLADNHTVNNKYLVRVLRVAHWTACDQ